MKFKRISYILTSLLLSTFACETTEKIDDFPLRPSSMVVNCYFEESNAWEFQVSKSLSVLDNADLKLLTNARVKVFSDNELLADITVPDNDGWYRNTDSKPQYGKDYRIEVSSPDFDNIMRATNRIPEKVEITGAELLVKDSSFYEWTDYEGNLFERGNLDGSFLIRFQDPASISNYYELSVIYSDTARQYENYEQYEVYQEKLWLTSEDAGVDYGGDGSTALLISDMIFDGQAYQIKVDFIDRSASRQKKYFITLLSLGYPGYVYRQTVAAYRDAVNDPFAEPVQIYSNVEHGYGIFAGQAVSIFSAQLQ